MALAVTALYAGLLGLWLIFLLFVVVRFRWRSRVVLGDGGDDRGERLIRAHGNAAETMPMFLILLGLAEGMGAPHGYLHAVGAAFCIGRVLHGAHFLQGARGLAARSSGMVLTIFPTVILALDLLRRAVMS